MFTKHTRRWCYRRFSQGETGGRGAGGRNDPNNICTYEYMNKEKKRFSQPFPALSAYQTIYFLQRWHIFSP
jgi:hypothetical protein